MIEIIINDFDNEINKLSDRILNSNIETYIENDGIGSYEFWGQKGFDHGTTYLVINDKESFIIKSKVSIKKLKDSLPNIRTIIKGIFTLELKLSIIQKSLFTYQIEWTEI
jgi:hypothetical protein